MKTVSQYPHAMFSWVDLSSTDPEKAKAFYSGLFAWEGVDQPLPNGGVYTMMQIDGHDVAGLSGMQPEMMEMGIPSHWSSYITVANLDETIGKVADLGGQVIAPPFDVMETGRMAVISDPTGGRVAFWEPMSHIGASVVNYPGSLVWNELATKDTEAAAKFYGALLGWEYHIDPTPEGGYHMFMKDGRAQAGMLQMTDEWGEMPANWMPYFRVANFAETAAKVADLGGTMVVGPVTMSLGEFAVVQDPTGAVFTAIAFNEGMVDPPPGYDSW